MTDGDIGDGDVRDGDASEDAGTCNEFDRTGCPRVYSMAPIPFAELCGRFAELFCRANETCCTRPLEVYESLSACQASQLRRCSDSVEGLVFPDAIAAADILYSQTGIGATYADIGPAADMCTPLRFDEVIRRAMTGRVASGGACTWISCSSGLDCVAEADTATCQPALTDGSPCDAAGHCGQGDLACIAGTCRSLGAEDASCSADDECESRICEAGTCSAFDANAAYCVRLDLDHGPAFRR